ncbi:nodulation protein NodH [Pseudooceanicola sp. CBS1P-1]|uniref:Nodulation protein NodH n=1 Tax=Pseudooceanicola albus TaxID=2692189 RepID=A0A6L7FZL5_9RHOB|nr:MULTISPECIES: sulfotransferase domain-containing protein [Pseudooceanicola]MBT9383899.1 nodulation protein NodH [Pseudooceanicola endophyticus]MXN16688.1 nodulation protein NodH [Pseudooceanicola albus]
MPRFDCFILFADMRTGSNFLETNLNAFAGVTCHGEVFNPHFVGYPNRSDCLGISRAVRDADPGRMLAALRAAPGLNGFRFFHDHDARVPEALIADPRCAKIVLGRNPLDSYVSWKIARATDQWKLTDVRRRRQQRIRFDPEEFLRFWEGMKQFRLRLLRRLQDSGQAAFWLDYEDLRALEVINGLAAFLGVQERRGALDDSLKVQNPGPLEDKVENPEEMRAALARLDPFGLDRVPDFEPGRGPRVPGFIGGRRVPLLFLPVPGGTEVDLAAWLEAVEGGAVERDFNRRRLRDWQAGHPGHRSFTVIRHPLPRLHEVFCRKILDPGPGHLPEMRRILVNRFGMKLPDSLGPGYGAEAHRALFRDFLEFLKANLAGQTGLRIDAHWASQAAVLEGMAPVLSPDLVLREEELPEMLPALAQRLGGQAVPLPVTAWRPPVPLEAVLEPEIIARVEEICQRDMLAFGFGRWPG